MGRPATRVHYKPEGYAHRHITTARYGSSEHYEHRTKRVRATAQIDDPDDSKLYVYSVTQEECQDFKRWFEGTFDGITVRIKGKYPRYYVVRG